MNTPAWLVHETRWAGAGRCARTGLRSLRTAVSTGAAGCRWWRAVVGRGPHRQLDPPPNHTSKTRAVSS